MSKNKICVVGLGYVGLPLAIELANCYDVIGYDISSERVSDLSKNIDPNGEVASDVLKNSTACWSSNKEDLTGNDIFIVTVPTPVDFNNNPDLSYLISASDLVGSYLKSGGLVIYESTVFPGCTEEVCKPVLENASGLIHGQDFYLGYSPERVNPADRINTISKIVKVVSGCCEKSGDMVSSLYSRIIEAGTYRAPTIKVAEAAKITENIQRDVNIALMNELSSVFNKLDVDTFEVIKAASSKWNFIPFRPGLVGGHCIGVDPYYLIKHAADHNIETPVMTSARQVNEAVVNRVVNRVKHLDLNRKPNILLMGLTFKEDCPDLRNSKSVLLANNLSICANVHAMDPFVESAISDKYKIVNDFSGAPYDCVIISVLHSNFLNLDPKFIRELVLPKGKVFDLLNGFPSIKDFSL